MEKAIAIVENPAKDMWPDLIKRPTAEEGNLNATVERIFDAVDKQGDVALRRFTKEFDRVALNNFSVATEEISAAARVLPLELKNAISLAKGNIEKFHRAQGTETIVVETTAGVQCWQEKKPIQKVGLYIPGGTAPLFSTILMLAVPAKIAGCEEIILCSPPGKDGHLDPAILYTAQLCGVTKIYKIGGIQAIAAMTFGTESIPRVYKIFGPGNQFVSAAKQAATKKGVAIDMPAGPSELLVMADTTAVPAFVASDLLSQAEHGEDSQVLLVSDSKSFLSEVDLHLREQLKNLPRKSIATKALGNSRFILMHNREECLDFINEYAPEHLMICTDNDDFFCTGIKNAGSVFLGNYSPESAGDYASGTNHTLPTNGYAKQYSGVNLDSFTKAITYQRISRSGLATIGPAIELMAAAEGLQAHRNAVSIRLNQFENSDENNI